jgi:phage terminase large subunit-like protein
LKEEIPGIIPINPTESKVARARAVTPEVESGNVLLPYPGDPGNEWVPDYLAEFRSFPTGAHDDQVDMTTQALRRMRGPRTGSVSVPGRQTPNGSTLATALATRRMRGR